MGYRIYWTMPPFRTELICGWRCTTLCVASSAIGGKLSNKMDWAGCRGSTILDSPYPDLNLSPESVIASHASTTRLVSSR
ncbi:hypothetical protein NQ318_007820 [Aromia moschata]|uniref:Uncharacterized protein n=1 Tax=Aromia moschata TaxID=1265417 RepID=A0AAV8Z210_9CUCU|nr:hypothetical protein NQ318_007820 [Aromia moschata]